MSMRRRVLVIALALAGQFALGGCGGGDDDPAPPPWSGVTIDQPTAEESWTTDATSVRLGGRAFVPTGSMCNALGGMVAPGYRVRWRNATTGESSLANVQLYCLLQVNLVWDSFPIALAVGSNPITVTASDATGRTGTDSIVITRLAPGP